MPCRWVIMGAWSPNAPIHDFLENHRGLTHRCPAWIIFRSTASDNTDSASIKVKVNLQPVDIKVTQKRSGEWAVEATPPTPIEEGRAWIKVTGMSHDGCDQIHTWNVYAGH